MSTDPQGSVIPPSSNDGSPAATMLFGPRTRFATMFTQGFPDQRKGFLFLLSELPNLL
jgi:hypothetical protein